MKDTTDIKIAFIWMFMGLAWILSGVIGWFVLSKEPRFAIAILGIPGGIAFVSGLVGFTELFTSKP